MSVATAAGDFLAVSRRLLDVLGGDGLGGEWEQRDLAVDGIEPRWVALPESEEQVAAVLRIASEEGLAVVPAGRGARLGQGRPPSRLDLVLSIERLSRTIEHAEADLTLTVEAGATLADVAERLRPAKQWLPLDPPLAERTTIGGLLAANASGPSRLRHGTVRESLLGLRAILADGTAVKSGGRVVKNVAGYDLCKLLIGSLGTLAIITQVTLKLRPQPETRRLVWAPIGDLQTAERVLDGLLTSQARPVALELLNAKAARQLQSELVSPLPADTPVLCLAVEGTEHEADWQIATLRQELAPFQPLDLLTIADEAAGKLWSALVEYQAASDDPVTFQASLPPSRTVEFLAAATESGVAAQAHAGNGIVIGHLPDRCTAADEAARLIDPLRALARRHGGALVLLNCEQAWKAPLSVFGPDRPESGLMRRVKACLDPHDVLNPGRLWSAQR